MIIAKNINNPPTFLVIVSAEPIPQVNKTNPIERRAIATVMFNVATSILLTILLRELYNFKAIRAMR
jgi:hypothetical protein